jgi:hypothetical protein
LDRLADHLTVVRPSGSSCNFADSW